MELPRAADILHEQYKKHIKGFESRCPDNFPESYNSTAIDAMHEYARRMLDVAAEEALITIEKDEDGEYRTVVAKSSILRLKELLK